MRVLRAYAEAGALGQQHSGPGILSRPEEKVTRAKPKPSKSGDSLTLSDEAREMLANGGSSISVMPHDATYDRQGHVMREFDNMQADLRALTSQFIGEPGVLGKLGSIQSQLTSLRASV